MSRSGGSRMHSRFLAKVDSGGHSLNEVIQEKGLKGEISSILNTVG